MPEPKITESAPHERIEKGVMVPCVKLSAEFPEYPVSGTRYPPMEEVQVFPSDDAMRADMPGVRKRFAVLVAARHAAYLKVDSDLLKQNQTKGGASHA